MKIILGETKSSGRKRHWSRCPRSYAALTDHAATVDAPGLTGTLRKSINLNEADHVNLSDTDTHVATTNQKIRQGGKQEKNR